MRNEQEKLNDPEFLDPNHNYMLVMIELRDRIEKLQLDMLHITDAQLLGIATEIYTDLRIKYFDMMNKDLTLQKLYEDENEEEEEEI